MGIKSVSERIKRAREVVGGKMIVEAGLAVHERMIEAKDKERAPEP